MHRMSTRAVTLLLGDVSGEGACKIQAEETPLPERYGHTMKAIQRIRQASAWGLSALALSTVLLCSVACTRGDDKNPSPNGTTDGSSAVTTPASGNNGSGSSTTRPLDPNAGTVAPNGDAGDPPAGTEGGSRGRSTLPRMMH